MTRHAQHPTRLQVDPRNPDPGAIAAAIRALQSGALIILPTDTVYGVAADPRVAGALEKIYSAKQRERGKPVPLLAASLNDVIRAGAVINPLARRLAQSFWPGPLTIVLPQGDASEGYRVPAHAVTLAVLRAAGGLLRVTSANVSGAREALTADEAIAALGPHCALALDAGPAKGGVPSTVVRTTGGRIEIIRAGAIGEAALHQGSVGQGRPHHHIIFVCTGNTCRSPMAEYLFRKWAGPGSDWHAISAGTAAVPGLPASRIAIDVMQNFGVDLTPHHSRILRRELIDHSDIIVVMAEAHRRRVLELQPAARERVFLFTAFGPGADGTDVPDPIGDSVQAYRDVAATLDRIMPDLVLALHEKKLVRPHRKRD